MKVSADGERVTQGPSSSVEWFYAGQAIAAERLTCALPVSAKNLVFTPGGSDAMAHPPRTIATGSRPPAPPITTTTPAAARGSIPVPAFNAAISNNGLAAYAKLFARSRRSNLQRRRPRQLRALVDSRNQPRSCGSNCRRYRFGCAQCPGEANAFLRRPLTCLLVFHQAATKLPF